MKMADLRGFSRHSWFEATGHPPILSQSRRAYERAAASIKELGEMIHHASAEAVEEVKALTRTE